MNSSPKPDDAANPFTANTQPAYEGPAIMLRPTGVTVVAVLCIIGGIMGLLSGLMLFGQQFAQKFAASFAPAGAAGDAQREWWAELQAINDRFLIPNLSIALVAIVLGVCLAIGGIALLQPKKWSREWLRRTFLFAIVFEVLRQGVFVVMQVAMFPVMQRQFDAMAPAGGGGNAAMDPEVFQSMQLIIMLLGYGFGVLWFLTKLVAYIWGRRYLKRDNVKAYCGESID